MSDIRPLECIHWVLTQFSIQTECMQKTEMNERHLTSKVRSLGIDKFSIQIECIQKIF